MLIIYEKQIKDVKLKEVAKILGCGERQARNRLKNEGLLQSRKEFERKAKKRRKKAYDLRQQGLKYKEIAEKLQISVNNAQQLVRRYKESIEPKGENNDRLQSGNSQRTASKAS